MKIKLSAVIPTTQYGNIQPEFEAEVEAGTQVEEMLVLERYVQELWDKYGERPLTLNTSPNIKRLKDFFGNEIDYDESTHQYSWKGVTYESGSQYAKRFEKPFDASAISEAMAKKYGVDSDQIRAMWELKARTSREFGTALHSALELYGRFNGLAAALERESHLHDHPVIKKAVQDFYASHKDETAEYEVLVVDHKNKRAGRIDRLLILGDNECQVQDYKTNSEMTSDKLKVYWKQLDFYSQIIMMNGWKCIQPVVFHYNGEWNLYNK